MSVKKGATILMVLYAIMMLSYGSLEMTHDLLHYLAAHHHSHLHDHEHHHHHHFSDHQHTSVHHHHHDDAEDQTSSLPTLINFFLFIQRKPSFQFITSFSGLINSPSTFSSQPADRNPSSPPPEKMPQPILEQYFLFVA